jgi:transposase
MQNPKKQKRKKTVEVPKLDSLKQINLNASGIDIGSTEIWVCVPEDRDEKSVKKFGTFTSDLHQIAAWLKACNVKTVAMESTSIYWIPLYDILEHEGFEVYVVNARTVKNVPGRKRDILDCQWIQQLHTYGLLRASFRPPEQIRRLRELSRHRDDLIEHRASHIHHMQKALHLMNLQLDNVISDITGKTGMLIIRDIIVGQREPKVLAKHRDPNCKNSQEVIEKSLCGNYTPEHLFQLKQAVELYDFYTKKIAECDKEMEKQYQQLPEKVDLHQSPLPASKKYNTHSKNAPDFDLRTQLYRICGVDLTAVPGLHATTVNTVITETGPDMSSWVTEKHFSSWLCLCPTNDTSGGKILSTKTRKTSNRANKALRQAAQSLHHSKSYLGAYYRRMHARLGPAKAITATANKLSRIIYHMLKEQKEYVELSEDYYMRKYKEREINKLIKKANALGFYLTPAQGVS